MNTGPLMRGIAYSVLLVITMSHAQSSANRVTGNTSGSARRSDFVYVSLDAEQSIAVYSIDSASGELSFFKKIVVSGQPGALGVDPARRFLYAAIRSTSSISSFRINPRTGDLTLINTISAAGNPVFVATDRAGKFVLSAYFADSKAAIHAVREDGGLRDSAVQILATEKNAHAIQTDPSNRFLYIPCRTGETIQQFRFDSGAGTLTPNDPDRAPTPARTGPRHLAFHPSADFAYFVNEFGSSVTAYHASRTDGTLSEIHTLSALPADFTGANSGADIHITPDGRFLYASNRGHESIAAFSVDAVSGRMTFVGCFATEKTPRSFALDPGGRFLFAASQGSGNVAAYRIRSADGNLAPIKTYNAGKNPVWILAVRPESE